MNETISWLKINAWWFFPIIVIIVALIPIFKKKKEKNIHIERDTITTLGDQSPGKVDRDYKIIEKK